MKGYPEMLTEIQIDESRGAEQRMTRHGSVRARTSWHPGEFLGQNATEAEIAETTSGP
jgi:hypothetical protein